tara:strand:+ start:5772 stop:7622 length:1851 start_codon:yes stop_codon:yes gene_type:complete
MSDIKFITKQNSVTIVLPYTTFVGDADGDFVASNGTQGTDSVKVTRSEDSKVLIDIADYTRIVDGDGTQIGSTRDLTVSNLNSDFLNPGTSIANIGDVIEDASLDKTAGKKLYLVMDSGKFKVTNIPDTEVINTTLTTPAGQNPVQIRLTETLQNSLTQHTSVKLAGGTGITTTRTNGTTITIDGFSGDYDDLTSKPSLATVATSGDYNDLSNLPTIPTDTNTNIGNTDMTLSGTRSVNMNGNDLNFKDGLVSKLQYDDSADEWIFGAPVRFDESTGGEIKLREASQGGTSGVILKAPSGNLSEDVEFRLPSEDGNSGQVIKTDGSGNLSFVDQTTDTDTTLDDTDVTLSGNRVIDTNGNNFEIKDGAVAKFSYTDATDALDLNALTIVKAKTAAGKIRMLEIPTNGSNYTEIKAADSITTNTTFTLPSADGTDGQVLTTDGSGGLRFEDAGGSTTLTQVYSQSFLDNIGTTKHYLPFKDINEQTTIYQEEAAMFMPFDGKVRSVSIRIPAITGTSGNMTVGVHTINTGNTGLFNSGLWTTEETETVAVATTDDHRSIHFVFDDAQHFEAGDLLAISIQCSTSLFGGSKYVYVSTIIDYDTSNTMPSTSQVLSSNP